MSWGIDAWGEGPWGGGPAITLSLAESVAENRVRLTFSSPVLTRGLLEPGDAIDPDLYEMDAVTTTIGNDGNPAREAEVVKVEAVEDNTSQVDLILDRPMSPWPARYTVSGDGLLGLFGEQVDNFMFEILAQQKGIVPLLPEQTSAGNRDVAFGKKVAESPEQTIGAYAYDSTGDLANVEGLESYRKRVFRRLTTRKGSFAHLPNYGLLSLDNVKRLARPAERQALVADAEDQIRQEPETASVTVTLENSGSLFRLRVVAKMKSGQTSILTAPLRTE